MGLSYTDSYVLANAITTTGTTTSVGFDTSKRQLRSVQILATSFTSGSLNIRFDVSNDGTNWVTYQRLTKNLTNTNAQQDTRIGAVNNTEFSTGPSAGNGLSAIYFFPIGDFFRYIRSRTQIITDGTVTITLEQAG